MSNPQSLNFAVSNFIALEVQLQGCMDYIPYIENNRGVISSKFIPIIMDACSLIESIFKSFADNTNERYNLKKYSKLYEPSMLLEDNISLFLASPIEPLNPFKDWTKCQPDWWAAYNSLKHDRLSNYQAATFTNAVMALAGLHQIMARSKTFIGSFLRVGWISTEEIETVADLSSVAHQGSLHLQPPSLVIESSLFVSSTRENFVKSFDNLYFDIDYDMSGISNRLRNLLFAHEEW